MSCNSITTGVSNFQNFVRSSAHPFIRSSVHLVSCSSDPRKIISRIPNNIITLKLNFIMAMIWSWLPFIVLPEALDVAGGNRFSLRVEINRCQTILPRFELIITNSSWPLPAQHHFRRRLQGLVRRSQSRSRETLESKVRDPSSPASLAKTPWGLGQASRLETTRDKITSLSPCSEL